MPQTLLALFALMISSFLVLNQQRLTAGARQHMVSDEIELAASGLASDIMEMAAARSFDEGATPEAVRYYQRIPTGASDFSGAATLGATDRGTDGCDLLQPAATPDCDDLDDVAGLGWQPVQIGLAHRRTLDFEANLDVYYVSSPESMDRSLVPTRHKRVVLEVRSPYLTMGDGTITVTRVVSYDPIKTELDYERIFGAIGTLPPGGGGWTPNATVVDVATP